MNFWERNDFNTQDTAYSNNNGNCRGTEEDIRNKFDSYAGKSEDQLMSELNATVERMKREGTFDVAQMENLYNTSAPFLNDEQRRRMRSIIDMLKG